MLPELDPYEVANEGFDGGSPSASIPSLMSWEGDRTGRLTAALADLDTEYDDR
jgi:hypothetical protein